MDSNELSERRGLARLGLLNGLFIGLALALGLWAPALSVLLQLPVSRLPYLTLLGAALLVIAVCAFAGWLSGRLRHTGASLFIWLAAAVLVVLVVGYRSAQLSTYLAWLLEPALYGRQVYAPQEVGAAAIILSGLFILLALLVLALLQEYRLEGLLSELRPGGGISRSGWTRLALPAVLALIAGFATGTIFGDRPSSRVLRDTQRAIDVASSYEGDLFALGLEEGINYAALRGVQGQLAGDYTLTLTQTDPETSLTTVTAHFQSGAWINCRFINEQLTFCEDASAPYTLGFSSLITGREPQCDGCQPIVDAAWTSWLAARRSRLGTAPHIAFVRQRGAHVLMRAAHPDGSGAISCWFEGLDPVHLLQCQELGP